MRPCVLALHGAAANAATWIPLQRRLAGDCDVVAPDLPGHGARQTEAFVLEPAIAELARTVADTARDRRVFVAGDSLGGYLALAVAARARGAVSGVIAGSCTFPMTGAPALLARLSLVADVITAEWPFRVLARAVAPADVSAAIIAGGFAPRMRGITLRALLGRDIAADIRAIEAPIFFVDGAYDVPIIWYGPAFARIARRGRFRRVGRAGHGVGLTHPDAFAGAVRECITAAEAASND